MPTWLHVGLIFQLLERLWGILAAFWARLGILERLGGPWYLLGAVLGTSWGGHGASWERLVGVLGRLGDVLEASWGHLRPS